MLRAACFDDQNEMIGGDSTADPTPEKRLVKRYLVIYYGVYIYRYKQQHHCLLRSILGKHVCVQTCNLHL